MSRRSKRRPRRERVARTTEDRLLTRRPARPAILRRTEPTPTELRDQAALTEAALVACPSYGVRLKPDGVYIEPFRPDRTICPRCGGLVEAVAFRGCPVMLDYGQVLRMAVPPAAMHEELIVAER